MAMQNDVLAARIGASGQAVTGRCRIRGYQIAPGAAGQVEFYDNATTNSGTVRLKVDTTSSTAVISMLLPGEGILFTNGVHITLPASTAITVFYA